MTSFSSELIISMRVPFLLSLDAVPVFVSQHDPLDHQSDLAEPLFPQSFQDGIMSVLNQSEKRRISNF